MNTVKTFFLKVNFFHLLQDKILNRINVRQAQRPLTNSEKKHKVINTWVVVIKRKYQRIKTTESHQCSLLYALFTNYQIRF